jgi:hypothetical protein
MSLKDLPQLKMESAETQNLQDNVFKYVKQLNPIVLDGILLEKITSGGNQIDITIGTATTLVPHGLGRKIQGWQVVDTLADARIWRDSTSTADLARFLPLRASASVTIKLWVF